MKLRIRGNSVRFRLLRGEVDTLVEKGFISEETKVSPGPEGTFYYGVIISDEAVDIDAKFEGGRIMIILPRGIAKEWSEGDGVGIEGSRNGLDILVEKDLACPGRPGDPDNAGAF